MSDKPRAAFLDFIKSYTDQNPVTIPRALVMLTNGDWTAAAMLNQILYWCGVSTDPDNWFWKTDAQWLDELCITRHQLNRYKKLMKDYGVETTRRKVQGAPTNHYRVDEDKLQEVITPILSNSRNCGHPQMRRLKHPQLQLNPSAIADNPPTETIEETTRNTDVSNDTSPADAGTVEQTSQVEHMVSMQTEVIETITPVLEERIEEPPKEKVPAKRKRPQPTPRTPNPLFDSVAKLQFNIQDTSDVKGDGGRIGKVVKVIEDDYKQRHNLAELSPHEREGLARIHAKFWIWYTEVKYPPKGDEKTQLKDSEKVGEYWREYRAYRNAPKPEPQPDLVPVARIGEPFTPPTAGGKWGGV